MRAILASALLLCPGILVAQSGDQPDTNQIWIREINTLGSGCEPSTFAINLSSDKKAFTLSFSEFIASIGPSIDPSEAYKNCAVTLTLNVPAGWQYSVGTFNYRGFMDVAANVRAEHSTSYFFQGTGQTGSFTAIEQGPIVKDFTYTDKIGLNSAYIPDTWSPCSTPRALTINPTIRLIRQPGHNSQDESFITNDTVDGELVQKFGMVWRKCGQTPPQPEPEQPKPSKLPEAGGVYELVSRHSNKCLDVAALSLENGAVLQQWECNGKINQKFRLNAHENGQYSLVGIQSGKTISVQDSFGANGTPVIQWDNFGSSNQRFKLVSSVGESFTLRFAHSQKCMDIAGTNTANGQRVLQWDCVGVADQDWSFRRVSEPQPETWDGVYTLKNRLSNKCLDISSGSTASGTLAQQWDCDNSNKQKYRLKNSDGDTYTLTAVHSNKCLEVRDGAQWDKVDIIQNECKGTAQQKVRIVASSNGFNTLRFVHSGRCLDIAGTGNANGAKAHQYECVGVQDQEWQLQKTSDASSLEGRYALVGRYSNKCLDVRSASQDVGATTQQWDCSGSANQRFFLTPAENGSYQLVAQHSNKCLGVKDASKGDLAQIVQMHCSNAGEQRVTLQASKNGSYTVRFVHSGKCLDVAGTSAANGQNILQYQCVGVDDQDWFLRP